jgi:hypothetical protein
MRTGRRVRGVGSCRRESPLADDRDCQDLDRLRLGSGWRRRKPGSRGLAMASEGSGWFGVCHRVLRRRRGDVWPSRNPGASAGCEGGATMVGQVVVRRDRDVWRPKRPEAIPYPRACPGGWLSDAEMGAKNGEVWTFESSVGGMAAYVQMRWRKA